VKGIVYLSLSYNEIALLFGKERNDIMSRMSKSCNYIEKNIQKISGYGFLSHPEWEDEVEMFANKLEEMIEQSVKEDGDQNDT
jgi:hypothetical protein